MQFKEIGEMVHLTGQAVANRVARLEKLGIIKAYRAMIDEVKIGNLFKAYVTVFMKTTNHKGVHNFLNDNEGVIEADRITGDGCYILLVAYKS